MEDENKFSLNIEKDVTIVSDSTFREPKEVALEQSKNVTCEDLIEIGDVVLTKGDYKLVVITEAPYHIEGKGYFDFAGKVIGDNSAQLMLLNRNNIEEVVKKNESTN